MLILIATPSVTAQEPSEFDFDLFLRNGQLVVWVDLAPLLTSRSVDRLQEGIELAFETQASLVIPKRIWADTKVSSVVRSLRLSYQKLTSEYQISETIGLSDTALLTGSLAAAYRYLHDSVEINLGDTLQMDPERHHSIYLDISSISLTDLHLTRRLAVDSSFSSPIWYLFRQFLHLTDYGRSDYHINSGSFSLRDLREVD